MLDPQITELIPKFQIDVTDVDADGELVEIIDERPPHVLVCVHGIRDDGNWGNIAATAIGGLADTKVEIVCVRYDRVSSFGFLLGNGRNKNNIDVIDQLSFIRNKFPDSLISIICHSNGTKLVSEIIQALTFEIEWLFLCGSVCTTADVRTLRIARRYPVNEIASKDWWPLIAETLAPKRFQSTGSTGFNMYPIVDRLFPYNHGGAIDVAPRA